MPGFTSCKCPTSTQNNEDRHDGFCFSTAAISVLALWCSSAVELDVLQRCGTNCFRVLRAARTCVLNSSSWASMLGVVLSSPHSPIPQHSSAPNKRSKVNQGNCCPSGWGCTPYVLWVVTPVAGSENSHELAKTQFQIPRSILMAGSPTAPSIQNNPFRPATSIGRLSSSTLLLDNYEDSGVPLWQTPATCTHQSKVLLVNDVITPPCLSNHLSSRNLSSRLLRPWHPANCAVKWIQPHMVATHTFSQLFFNAPPEHPPWTLQSWPDVTQDSWHCQHASSGQKYQCKWYFSTCLRRWSTVFWHSGQDLLRLDAMHSLTTLLSCACEVTCCEVNGIGSIVDCCNVDGVGSAPVVAPICGPCATDTTVKVTTVKCTKSIYPFTETSISSSSIITQWRQVPLCDAPS